MKELRLKRRDPVVRHHVDLNVYLAQNGFDLERPIECRHDMMADEYVYTQNPRAKRHAKLIAREQN